MATKRNLSALFGIYAVTLGMNAEMPTLEENKNGVSIYNKRPLTKKQRKRRAMNALQKKSRKQNR